MNTHKQLQLVTFEQAKRLKAAGFEWYYPICYAINPNTHEPELCYRGIAITHNNRIVCSAPTVALALKWFRDEKDIFCGILPNFSTSYYGFIGCSEVTGRLESYESSESALLDELLTIIEK